MRIILIPPNNFLMEFFNRKFHINVEYINARSRFISKLKGIIDPEEKRRIIGTEFIRVFDYSDIAAN